MISIINGYSIIVFYYRFTPLQPRRNSIKLNGNLGTLTYHVGFFPKEPTQFPNTFSSNDLKKPGILSIQIHQAQLHCILGRESNVSNTSIHPSTYCLIYVNDQKHFITRTKYQDSAPFWNARTEIIWKGNETGRVTIVIKNSMALQNDPIVGIVVLPISCIFQNQNECTAWYPITRGIGKGKIRISLRFDKIDLELPKDLIPFGKVSFTIFHQHKYLIFI